MSTSEHLKRTINPKYRKLNERKLLQKVAEREKSWNTLFQKYQGVTDDEDPIRFADSDWETFLNKCNDQPVKNGDNCSLNSEKECDTENSASSNLSTKDVLKANELQIPSEDECDTLSSTSTHSLSKPVLNGTELLNYVVDKQEKASAVSHVPQKLVSNVEFLDLSLYSNSNPNLFIVNSNNKMLNSSIIKMPIKRRVIGKKIVEGKNYDEKSENVSSLSVSKHCERERARESAVNNEEEKKHQNVKSSVIPQRRKRLITEYDIEVQHFFTHHFEDLIKNPGSVLIPLPKKRKKDKFTSLDWQSIMNGK